MKDKYNIISLSQNKNRCRAKHTPTCNSKYGQTRCRCLTDL